MRLESAASLAPRRLAGRADEIPPLPGRPHVPRRLGAPSRSRAPRHRARRDGRRSLHHPQPPARAGQAAGGLRRQHRCDLVAQQQVVGAISAPNVDQTEWRDRPGAEGRHPPSTTAPSIRCSSSTSPATSRSYQSVRLANLLSLPANDELAGRVGAAGGKKSGEADVMRQERNGSLLREEKMVVIGERTHGRLRRLAAVAAVLAALAAFVPGAALAGAKLLERNALRRGHDQRSLETCPRGRGAVAVAPPRRVTLARFLSTGPHLRLF